MMWGFYVPGFTDRIVSEPPAKHRCTVSDEWELGGGPGFERTHILHLPTSEGTKLAVIEFDDAPGFWWDVPRDLVAF